MQDRGSGGCLPSGQGSSCPETRGCAHSGELLRSTVYGDAIIHYAQANYKTLFDATLKFLDSFDTYANFQNI